MEEANHLTPSDERLFSGLSYLFGLVVALLIWGIQRDRSRLVRFHSMQAIGMDVLFFIIIVIVSGCLVITTFSTMTLMVAGISSTAWLVDTTSPTFLLALILPMGLPALIVVPMMLLICGMLFVRIHAAVRVFKGRDFRLPILGKQIEHLMITSY